MKVVKQLRQDSAEDRLRRFFQGMPIVTKALLLLYSFVALVILLAPSIEEYSAWTFFAMRFGEVALEICSWCSSTWWA
jgi:hypothetical protein